ncbi:MAG: tRNA epoxyqueuosine(34) reductase QueG [Phycisphaerales bacterium]
MPPTARPDSLRDEVLDFCRRQGFALAGICPAAPTSRPAEFDQWLADGKHAEMSWLAADAHTRKDPARELPSARSIIMVADRYADGHPDPPPPPGVPWGRVARYARGRDYHWFIKRRLHALNDSLRVRFPDHLFRTFVDTAPVLEREHAARAGLGWIGKHTLLIHPRDGSYLLLGGTLTSLDLGAADTLPPAVTDRCGTCTRCIDACPTRAITPYSVNAARCISYLTIEHQSPIDPALAKDMGDWIFGCDICQEVCPYNRPAPGSPVNPAYASDRRGFPLADILAWDEPAKRRAIEGSAMKRASLDMLQRNARIALENTLNS